MKIIAVCNNYPTQNKTQEIPLTIQHPIVLTKSDTTLLLAGKPFFVPDYAQPCTLQAELVVHVCRLGRHISERFAHRYYDAATIGISFTAENLRKELKAKGLPWDVAVGFDGSSALGEMVKLSPEEIQQAGFSFTLDSGTTLYKGEAAQMTFSIDKIIAHVSRYYTLRQGDLIFCGSPLPALEAELNTHVTGYLNDRRVLDFNIK